MKQIEFSPDVETQETSIIEPMAAAYGMDSVDMSNSDTSISDCHSTRRSPVTANKATQKSYQRPERRSKAIETESQEFKKELKEIGVQCNLVSLPPLGTVECSQTDSDDDDDGNDEGEMYCPLTSDSDEEMKETKEMTSEEQEKLKGSRKYHTERKYIVFESYLLELFRWCPVCNGPSEGKIVDTMGTFIKIVQKCKDADCQQEKVWTNQNFVRTMPVGNLLLSAAILMSGLPTQKTLRMFRFMNIACVSRSSFYRHTTNYVTPTIVQCWKEEQRSLLQKMRNEGNDLILSGDGRCDSPGHSAKFGSYTVIEQKTNRVLDFQLVQSNEVKNSSWMEVEGLKRSVALFETQNLSIDILITDRSTSISKYIRTKLPDTTHYYDIWHVAKGI
ncbi:hypothetical protein AC249_AIPGENE28460 [Exaiptasia diaphana]|nr:hypothetical protein AC249_AIPGENE28460 [Exaiptasia diaphana]